MAETIYLLGPRDLEHIIDISKRMARDSRDIHIQRIYFEALAEYLGYKGIKVPYKVGF